MILQQQPTRRSCGHTCVAMIVGVDAKDVLKIIPSRGTTYADVRKMLAHYHWHGGDRVVIKRDAPLPRSKHPLIARICYTGISKGKAHWVVLWNEQVYCARQAFPYPVDLYKSRLIGMGNFTSYMEVTQPK